MAATFNWGWAIQSALIDLIALIAAAGSSNQHGPGGFVCSVQLDGSAQVPIEPSLEHGQRYRLPDFPNHIERRRPGRHGPLLARIIALPQAELRGSHRPFYTRIPQSRRTVIKATYYGFWCMLFAIFEHSQSCRSHPTQAWESPVHLVIQAWKYAKFVLFNDALDMLSYRRDSQYKAIKRQEELGQRAGWTTIDVPFAKFNRRLIWMTPTQLQHWGGWLCVQLQPPQQD